MFVNDEVGKKWIDDVKFVHMLISDYKMLSAELSRFDITASLGGEGLLSYMSHLVLPETAAEVRAREVIKRLPRESGVMLNGAEIGVFTGEMSKNLLSRMDIKLTMVDSWTTQPVGSYADSDDFHATLTQEEQDGFHNQAKEAVMFAGDNAMILKASSLDAAKLVEDESLDFVFIDADHSYEGCKDDIEAWYPKVKKGGLFGGHDYDNIDFPKFGVKHAVDDFVFMKNYTIDKGENFTWFITK